MCYKDYKNSTSKDIKRTFASCVACKSVIQERGTTTSNYLRHTRTKHTKIGSTGKCYREYQEKQTMITKAVDQRSLFEFVKSGASNVPKYNRNDAKQKAITEKLVKLILESSLSLSIVERSAFKGFVDELNPKYSVPSRPTVVTQLAEQCHRVKHKLKEALKDKPVSVTLDLWTDRVMRSFLGITVHYREVNDLKSALLSCEYFKGSHTALNIAEAYECCLADYGITPIYAITDNASSMKKAFVVELEPDSDEDEPDIESVTDLPPEVDLKATRLSCFAHSLQLCVGDGLKANKNMNGALGKVSKISSMLHTSSKFKSQFDDAFNSDGGKRGIPQPVPTRWNSMLRQIESILKLTQNGLEMFLEKHNYTNLVLTAREWSQLEELCRLMLPFGEATDKTQGDKIVTISYVLPCILALEAHLISTRSTNLRSVREGLLRSLRSRFKGIFDKVDLRTINPQVPFSEEIYILSTTLDPNWCLTWIHTWREDDDIALTALAKDVVLKHCEPLLCRANVIDESASRLVDSGSSLFSLVKRKKVGGDENITNLFRSYVKAASNANTPQSFSKFHEPSNFGVISELALQILAVPATSAPVERVFSQGSIILCPKRASLSVDSLRNLIFLKCNTNL